MTGVVFLKNTSVPAIKIMRREKIKISLSTAMIVQTVEAFDWTRYYLMETSLDLNLNCGSFR